MPIEFRRCTLICRPFLSIFTGASLLALLSGATTAFAQSVTDVAPVVVSATRSERSEVSIPAAIQIIGREEIVASGARNVAELLRGRGGVQVADLFGDGSRPTIAMRGFGETAHSNTLVLVDGRRLNNTDIAPPDIAAISIKDIERIEIVEGSAGVLFGDQAVGGVVNIITRRARGLVAEGAVSAGSYGRRGAEVSLSHRLDNGLSYRLSGEKNKSDNYRRNNRRTYNNVLARVGYEHASGSVFAEFQQINENLEVPGALLRTELEGDRRQVVPGFENDYVNTNTVSERVGLQQAFGDNLSLEVELANRESDVAFLQSFRGFAVGTRINTQERHVTEFTPRLVGAWDTHAGEVLLSTGFDLTHTDYELQSIIGAQTNVQRVAGYYLQTVLPVVPRWSVTLGARYATLDNDLRDDFTFPASVDIDDSEFLTEFGIAFRPDKHSRLFARRDENLRFAKVDEYTDPVPGVILKTQTGVSWEFGAEWSSGAHTARMLAYRLELDDEISTVPGVGAFGLPANTNLDPTRRDGIVIGAGWQAFQQLHLSADWSYVDAKVVEGTLKGKRVPFVARHSLRLGADVQPLPGLTMHGEVVAVSNRLFAGDFDQKLPLFPGYGVVNFAVSYAIEGWTLGARMNNVLDKRYSEFGARATVFGPAPTFASTAVESFFPAPERNIWFSARYRFSM
jgi:iron complex outermembrane receptor protein